MDPFGTATEEAFDRLTRLAVRALPVPIAFIALFRGGEAWVASAAGPPELVRSLRRGPVPDSLRHHVIPVSEPLLVGELRADARFAGDAALAGLGVRACAGVPLRTADGVVHGALCVLDTRPREWTADEAAALADLAGAVAAELERGTVGECARRDADGTLRLSEARFRSLVAASAQMVWTAGHDGVPRGAHAEWGAFTGLDVRPGRARGWLKALHPGDRRPAHAVWRRAVAACTPFTLECRVRRADGEYRRFEVRGVPVVQEDGEVREWVGMGTDVTERLRAREVAAFLAEASDALGATIDYETTLRTVAHLAVPRMADWCTVDLLEGGTIRRVAVAHADARKQPLVARLQSFTRSLDAPGGAPEAIRTRQPVVYHDVASQGLEGVVPETEERALLARIGASSALAVPLVARGVALGAITLVSYESGRRYGPHDVPVALDLARRASLAVDHALLFHETEAARRHLENQAQEMERQVDELEVQAVLLEEGQAELEIANTELLQAQHTLMDEMEERARAEAAVRASEARMRARLEASPIPTYLWRSDGTELWLEEHNAAAAAATRGAVESLRGRTARSLYAAGNPGLLADLETCLAERRTIRRSGPYRTPLHPEERWLLATFSYVAPDSVMVHTQDLTEMKRAEEALRTSEARYRSVWEGAAEGFFLVDREPDGTFRFVESNPAMDRIRGDGGGVMAGRTPHEVLSPGDADAAVARLRTVFETGQTLEAEYEIALPGGSIVSRTRLHPMRDAAGAVTRVLATVEDVTERVRLEEQLRQASKMEAVGRLSGGVAHDFNNMLQSILGSADLLLADTPPEHAAYADLHEIRRAGRRAADLTRQLLAFSRQQVLAPRPLSLAESVAAIERMLGRMLGEDVELVTRLQADAGQVTADPTQVEQVLLNLAVNARDAMPDGGRLTIQVRGVELDADGIRRRSLDAEPGPYVLLEVGDTGRGMDAATQARIFEPFFTTKAVGEGTGLGLATVYGIVRQSGGAICVESSPGGGTRFSVFLPRIAAGGEGDAAPAAAAEPRAGSETVLVVEDEDAVRRLAGRVLRRYGYTVLEASSGHEAMAILREHAGAVNLLLTDAVMPHMGGRELVEAARAEFPALRVLFMSGYTSDAVVQRGVSEAELQFIQKPFSPHELGARVRSVLDGG